MAEKLYKRLSSNKLVCLLCSHFCKLSENETGICGVRKNIKGKIESLIEDMVAAKAADPIEKKPLFHVLPSSLSYSIASPGCNFSCMFCQNASIAQTPALYNQIRGEKMSYKNLVCEALLKDCKSISYTYSEPTVFFELMEKTGIYAKEKGLLNIMVSNGFISKPGLQKLKGIIDAANIDLKSFNENFYQKICNASLKPVLQTLKRMKENNIFIEVTTLLIPGINDSKEEIDQIAGFIKNELGKDTPWHISKFYPTFKMTDMPTTSVESIHNAVEAGEKHGLKFIYAGNVPGDPKESTYCPNCKKILIERQGYYVIENQVKNGKCFNCGESISGIF